MPSQAVLNAAASQSSTWSKLLVKYMIPAHEVVATLQRAGVRFVLAGAHANNAWANHVRATMDVDILVFARDHKKAVRAIVESYPSLKMKDREVVTRFADPETKRVIIDLMKPKDRLLCAVFEENYTRTIQLEGVQTNIPDLEAALAMKFAAMVGVYRQREDKMQDAADFARVLKANLKLNLSKLKRLGGLVYEGGAEEIASLVEKIRKGEPLVF